MCTIASGCTITSRFFGNFSSLHKTVQCRFIQIFSKNVNSSRQRVRIPPKLNFFADFRAKNGKIVQQITCIWPIWVVALLLQIKINNFEIFKLGLFVVTADALVYVDINQGIHKITKKKTLFKHFEIDDFETLWFWVTYKFIGSNWPPCSVMYSIIYKQTLFCSHSFIFFRIWNIIYLSLRKVLVNNLTMKLEDTRHP